VPVSREQVHAMAALARLRLTGEETDLFTGQLSGILDHMAELASVEVAGTGAGGSATDSAGSGPLRPDDPPPDALHGSLDDFAPERVAGLFTVPRLAELDGDSADPDGGP